MSMYSKSDAISSIKEASDILGHSPTRREYAELDLLPSASWIKYNFETWNDAKREANVDICKGHPEIDDVPEVIALNQEEWENLSSTRRLQLRKSAKYATKKMNSGCSNCGFNEHPTALEYHHTTGNKENSVGNMIRSNVAESKIDKEIKKCDILCSNCHKAETVDIYDTDKFNTIGD